MEKKFLDSGCVGIILAAGMGKRMKTALPKVAHTILGRPMIIWAINALRDAGLKRIVVVLSPGQIVVKEIIEDFCNNNKDLKIHIAWQSEALGTGHAARMGFEKCLEVFPNIVEDLHNQRVIVTFGDHPAVAGQTFREYLSCHLQNDDDLTVFAFEPGTAFGYGRILTKKSGKFKAIREEKDCSSEELKIPLCNAGFLCSRAEIFVEFLPKISNKNAAKEYYLTEIPELAVKQEKKIGIFRAQNEHELAGVNSQLQLASVAGFLQNRVTQSLMESGVQILNPQQVYIEPTVTFESDVIVEPFVYLSGNLKFKKGTRIKSGERH